MRFALVIDRQTWPSREIRANRQDLPRPPLAVQCLLHPRQRVAFVATGPDSELRELSGEELGQAFDAEAFAGVVAAEQERNAAGFGVVAGVQPGFTGNEEFAAQPRGFSQEFARAAAADSDALDRLLWIADA